MYQKKMQEIDLGENISTFLGMCAYGLGGFWVRRQGGGRAVKVQPDSGGGGGGGGGGSDSKSSEGKMGVFWVLPAGLSSTDIKDIKKWKGDF